jgi:hypothetical protein
MQKGRGTKWFIEGDLSACFDKIDHTVLINILKEKFQDNRFIRLISGLLKAGYLEDWKFNATFSGVPQGSVAGSIFNTFIIVCKFQFKSLGPMPIYIGCKPIRLNAENNFQQRMLYEEKLLGLAFTCNKPLVYMTP